LADDFTRRQFAWLDQVAADPAVTAAGFLLAYRIAKHINRGTGDAWPSQPLLATEARLSVRSIRDLTDQLEAAGHLTIIGSRGRGHSCRYRPILRAEPDHIEAGAEAETEEGEAEAGIDSATIDTPAPDAQEGELFPDTVDAVAARSAPRAKQDLTADFEAWWLQYPRKVSKGAARTAYDRARKSGATGDELELGAMRYAATRTGEDPKYTKHGATWLNNKCWLDEPEPPRSAGFDNRPPSGFQRPAPQSHLEIALAALNGDE
jgi:hypothetical protein